MDGRKRHLNPASISAFCALAVCGQQRALLGRHQNGGKQKTPTGRQTACGELSHRITSRPGEREP